MMKASTNMIKARVSMTRATTSMIRAIIRIIMVSMIRCNNVGCDPQCNSSKQKVRGGSNKATTKEANGEN